MFKPTTQEERYVKLTETPIKRLIGELSAPAIISMLIGAIYNMADTFFVGRIGTSATAAVGVVFSLTTVAQALAFTFGHGSGNYISRALGRRETGDAEKMAATGFFSATAAGIVIMVLGLCFLTQLVDMLGATDTCRDFSRQYAMYILMGTPFLMGSLVLNNQLRLQGSAFYGMIGMAAGALLNIAIDPLLIFVFDLGIAGAAIATAFCQMVSFVFLLVIVERSGNIRIRLKNFTPSGRLYLEIIRGGLPSLARQGIASVAGICLNRVAGVYGDAAVAAMSVVNRFINFAQSATIGVGQGFQPVCGFNYGARKYGRVREAFWFCTKVCFVILLAFSVASEIFAPQIIALFRDDPDVIEIGALALRFQCILFPLFSFVTLANMMLQTMGKVVPATLLALSRQGLFFIPAIMVLPGMFGLLGIQLALPVSDLLSIALALPIGLATLRRLKEDEPSVAVQKAG